MDNNAGTPKPSRPRRAPRCIPGARKRARYPRLQPADRSDFLRKVLRSYGIEDTIDLDGTPLVALAAESNSNLIFILALLEEAAQLTGLQALLAQAEGKPNLR